MRLITRMKLIEDVQPRPLSSVPEVNIQALKKSSLQRAKARFSWMTDRTIYSFLVAQRDREN